MRRCEAKGLVEGSYDVIAEAYLASKGGYDPKTYAPLEQLITILPAGAAVLDLGCGAGVPVSQRLARRLAVTGVDISARQLGLARAHVPTGHFIKADMTAVDFVPGTFDAVVSCYAIIHVPAAEQPDLVQRIYSWIKPAVSSSPRGRCKSARRPSRTGTGGARRCGGATWALMRTSVCSVRPVL